MLYQISSLFLTYIYISSTSNFAGCFQTSLFRSKPWTVLGTIIQFSYTELEYATDKFSNPNLIGQGGSSFVYRGQLRDGRIVAVKRLKTQGGPDADCVFSTEVLSQLAFRFHFLVEEGY